MPIFSIGSGDLRFAAAKKRPITRPKAQEEGSLPLNPRFNNPPLGDTRGMCHIATRPKVVIIGDPKDLSYS